MIDYDEVLDEANKIYAVEKCKQLGIDPAYCAPECIPEIGSKQVEAILKALIDAVNKQFEIEDSIRNQ